jgi:hypothetical protein
MSLASSYFIPSPKVRHHHEIYIVYYRFLKWQDFASHAMVHNPKGGTAVLPKQITATMKSGFWEGSKSKFAT